MLQLIELTLAHVENPQKLVARHYPHTPRLALEAPKVVA
jgi:hypothetical protein